MTISDIDTSMSGEEILARKIDVEVMGPPRRLYSNFIRGIRELPARIRAN